MSGTGQAEEDRMKRGLGLLVTGMLLVTACSGTTPTTAPTGTAAATGTPARGDGHAGRQRRARRLQQVEPRHRARRARRRADTCRLDAQLHRRPSQAVAVQGRQDEVRSSPPGLDRRTLGRAATTTSTTVCSLSQAGSVADKPDVIQMDNIWLGQFTENGMLANLDSYYASWDGESDISTRTRIRRSGTAASRPSGATATSGCCIWNKDVFKAAGLDPEKGPATWDDVMADCHGHQGPRSPGVSPVGFPAASQEGTVDRFYPYLFMTGSNILSADNKTAVFNDAGGQKAVQFYVDLVKSGCTPQDVLNQDADAVSDAVFAGKYGMMLATVGDGFGSQPDSISDGDFGTHYRSHRSAHLHGCQRRPPRAAGCSASTGPAKRRTWPGNTSWTSPTGRAWSRSRRPTPGSRSASPALAQTDAFKADPYFDRIGGGGEGRPLPALRRPVHGDDRTHLDRHPDRNPGHFAEGRTGSGGN